MNAVLTLRAFGLLTLSDQWRWRQREPHMRSRPAMNEASRSALRFERAESEREGSKNYGVWQ